MNNKVVIITGAAGGIGSATARKYAKDGAKLVLVDLSEQSLISLAQELGLTNDNSILVAADVSKEEQVKYYVDRTIQKFGQINVFVNNAGTEGKVESIINTTNENLDIVLGVNVKGLYFGLKYVMKQMLTQQSGSIINTSSVAGFMGSPGLAPYVASKHAVLGITKTAALEGAPYVRVNAVCPGPVNNRMMRSIEDGVMPGKGEDVKKGFEATIPMGKYAENEDIANTIYYLGSDEAKYITGTTIRVDGGMGAK